MEYRRYGVNENPFQLRPLPIGDSRGFEPVHRFDETSIESSLASCIAEKRLASYVITGTSGSGRTAVARYIMTLYGKLFKAGSQRPRPIAHYERAHDGNVNGRQVACEVLKGVVDEVRSVGGADLRDGPVRRVRNELRELTDNYSVQDLQTITREFLADLKSFDAGSTCCVENVPNLDVFRSVRNMFAKSTGLLVCTIVAEQREAILGTLKSEDIAEEIVLTDLADDRACGLAASRWEIFRAIPPLPFDADGLRNAFHDNPRTVGKSLQTLAFMINTKLATYPGASVHPADPGLHFDEKQIRAIIKIFDERPR